MQQFPRAVHLTLLAIFVLTLPIGRPAIASDSATDPDWKALVDAEREFAKAADAEGIRKAFLTFLTDEAVVFQPHPVNGKKWYAAQPESPALLSWRPILAEVSGAGDLGYTTGPWEFRVSRDGDPVGFGHYVSVWQKRPNGSWRVLIDVGIVHVKPQNLPTDVERPNDDRPEMTSAADERSAPKARAAILELERSLARASTRGKHGEAFEANAADRVRLYRMGMFPIAGKEAALAALSRTPCALSWTPEIVVASTSGDLGYTYGISELRDGPSTGPAKQRFSYFRIWSRTADGAWKIILDLAIPILSSVEISNGDD